MPNKRHVSKEQALRLEYSEALGSRLEGVAAPGKVRLLLVLADRGHVKLRVIHQRGAGKKQEGIKSRRVKTRRSLRHQRQKQKKVGTNTCVILM